MTEMVKVSLWLRDDVYAALEQLAQDSAVETNAYIQRILNRHVMQSDALEESARKQVVLWEKIIERAVQQARELEASGRFDQNFTLTVFQELMKNPEFRSDYEKVVGGDAYERGLPGKTPLNMYLGWYIKNAVGADPILDSKGRPRRAQVRNAPIQSYTLLTK